MQLLPLRSKQLKSSLTSPARVPGINTALHLLCSDAFQAMFSLGKKQIYLQYLWNNTGIKTKLLSMERIFTICGLCHWSYLAILQREKTPKKCTNQKEKSPKEHPPKNPNQTRVKQKLIAPLMKSEWRWMWFSSGKPRTQVFSDSDSCNGSVFSLAAITCVQKHFFFFNRLSQRP